MPKPFKAQAVSLLACLLVTGCASVIAPPQSQKVYDLGTVVPAAAQSVARPLAIELKSPSWLASPAMQYRLDYAPPAPREYYAESRWVAHPAEMLQRSLTLALGAGSSTRNTCRLRIELDEFVQAFDAPATSTATIRGRAILSLPGSVEGAVAVHAFEVRQAAGSDAAAGVAAFRQGAGRLADTLQGWLEKAATTDARYRRCLADGASPGQAH